jgi:Fe-S-cluster containining protein
MRKSEIIKSRLCKNCGECCKCMVVPVSKPMAKSMEQSMLEWITVRGCDVVSETPAELFVKIPCPCPHLKKSGNEYGCDTYDSRPEGCRVFDGSKYEWLKCAWRDPKLVIK